MSPGRSSFTWTRRAVAVKFDDGYRDNYEIAAPILEKAGVPATFYVTVDCVESGKLPWVAASAMRSPQLGEQ
jgi:peptidoglycan/xylan/chitin deacetylase (PgdA/CDA1 family)